MGWYFVAAVAILIHVASGQVIRRPCPCPCPCPCPPVPTVVTPTIQPTIVDGNIVQSLIDTLQLFIVSDLLEDSLPEKQKIIAPSTFYDAAPFDYIAYDFDCDIPIYRDLIYDFECPDFVTAFVPSCKPSPCKRLNVNFGLNEELIMPPLAPELPCGLGYLPGGLPVVAKAFAPCTKCGGCGCASCSAAALPICSPCSGCALATPLCPDLSGLCKPVIL